MTETTPCLLEKIKKTFCLFLHVHRAEAKYPGAKALWGNNAYFALSGFQFCLIPEIILLPPRPKQNFTS